MSLLKPSVVITKVRLRLFFLRLPRRNPSPLPPLHPGGSYAFFIRRRLEKSMDLLRFINVSFYQKNTAKTGGRLWKKEIGRSCRASDRGSWRFPPRQACRVAAAFSVMINNKQEQSYPLKNRIPDRQLTIGIRHCTSLLQTPGRIEASFRDPRCFFTVFVGIRSCIC
ncbi:hypothetical protein ALCH109712_06720 [Alkalicoccus chagannorensis]